MIYASRSIIWFNHSVCPGKNRAQIGLSVPASSHLAQPPLSHVVDRLPRVAGNRLLGTEDVDVPPT